MEYIKSKKYDTPYYMSKIMGPNPIKLAEELLDGNLIPQGGVVCDLGSGQGLTSVFIAKEYGLLRVRNGFVERSRRKSTLFRRSRRSARSTAPRKSRRNFSAFDKGFFDAVVSLDSYNYFGRDENYLDDCLLPYVKKNGFVYIAVAGMKKDCHDNLPKELLLSWTSEQLEYMHDVDYWTSIVSKCKGADIVSIKEMESNDEVWEDWLRQDNPYAINDRKSMQAGAGKYLNFISIVLKKK